MQEQNAEDFVLHRPDRQSQAVLHRLRRRLHGTEPHLRQHLFGTRRTVLTIDIAHQQRSRQGSRLAGKAGHVD
jgi:hypothetical protein